MSATGPAALAETPDLNGAFPRLSDEQIGDARARGRAPRARRPDEVLFREGDRDYDFFVVLAGKVAVVAGYGGDDERLIAVHGPGRFLGELGLLTGQAALFTAVVREPGEVLRRAGRAPARADLAGLRARRPDPARLSCCAARC